jgi:hypothetical protein
MKKIFLTLLFVCALAISASATTITVAQNQLTGWVGPKDNVQLWLFLTEPMTLPNGQTLPGSAPGSAIAVVKVACTVTQGSTNGVVTYTLTIPSFTLEATLDAVRGRSALYLATFYRVPTNGIASKIAAYQGFEQFAVQPLPTNQNWGMISLYNKPPVPKKTDNSVFTREETLALLNGLITPQVSFTQEQYDTVPLAITPMRTTVELNDGLQGADDPNQQSTRLKTFGVPTGKRNVVTDYGGNSNVNTTTGTIVSGGFTLTVAQLLTFKPGNYIAIPGLGVSGATFYARILSINRTAKTFTLSAAPAGNGTNVVVYPDNFTPIQNALNELSGSVYFPAGYYRVFNDYNRILTIRGKSVIDGNLQGGEGNPTILEGSGQGSVWIRAMGDADLFRASKREDLENLQVRDMNFEAVGGIGNTTSRGWAFNLGLATVVNFPEFRNVQIKGFRGGIFCGNCQGGGFYNSVFRGNKLAGLVAIADQTTWLAGHENNGLSVEDNQFDFQSDPQTDSNRAVTGLSMPYEADNAVTDASYVVTAATSQFVANDLGKVLEITGAGTDGGTLMGLITEVISGTQVRYTTRGSRTADTVVSGDSGIIHRAPMGSAYFMRANWLTLKNNISQGNWGNPSLEGGSTGEINTFTIRNSNSVNFKNHYSEQGGGAAGAHVRLIDSYAISFEGFKTNSQGTCTPTPPAKVTSHCWDIWASDTPGIRVRGAGGSLSILHNKLEGSSTIDTEGLYGAPDLSNETGPQKEVYGDYHRNFQWGSVQIGTNTMYDGAFGDNYFPDGRLVDGNSGWSTLVPGSVTWNSDGLDRYKYYLRVNTTALATASVTELVTKRVNIPDGLMSQNFTFSFDYRPVTYPVGSDNTYTVDFYAKPSSGGTGYNWPTTFRWQIPGTNAAGLTPGHWYRLQVNLVLPAGTGRFFDIAIRGRRGALTPTVDFTNFQVMQGRHGAFSNKTPVNDVDGGKVYGEVYLPLKATGSDQYLGIEAATGKLKAMPPTGSDTPSGFQTPRTITQTAHGFGAANTFWAVYKDATGPNIWHKADSSDTAKMATGIVKVIDANTLCEFTTPGLYEVAGHGFSESIIYVLSTATVGAIEAGGSATLLNQKLLEAFSGGLLRIYPMPVPPSNAGGVAFQTSASNPTTATIPTGTCQVWFNSTTSVLRQWCNVSGTLKYIEFL